MKPTILVVDDDATLANTLSRSLTRRGFDTLIAHSAAHALRQAQRFPPSIAIVDLKLDGGSGIACIEALKLLVPNIRIAVLTGYASVTAALETVRSGAEAFLAKPATAADILSALDAPDENRPLPRPARKMSLRDLEWERINRALLDNDFNISATAEALHMARRHLQKRLRQGQAQDGRPSRATVASGAPRSEP